MARLATVTNVGRGLVILLLAVVAIFALAACETDATFEAERTQQQDNLTRGQAAVPVEPMDHFLSREGLKFWRDTMNVPSKLWYVYRINDLGQYYAYNICDTVPLSYGVSTTSPVTVSRIKGSDWQMPAPGLDAVYWSGADPSLYYCRDAETGAMIHFMSGRAEWYDKPLDLESLGSGDVPLIHFKLTNEENQGP